MKPNKKPPIRFTYEHAGRTWVGTYQIDRRVITVKTAIGSKSAQLGNLPPDLLARQLAGELSRQNREPHKSPIPTARRSPLGSASPFRGPPGQQ
jgi:hypothetical protein